MTSTNYLGRVLSMKVLKSLIGIGNCDPQHEGKLPMRTKTRSPIVIAFIMVMAHAPAAKGKAKIAEEAFIYGFPMVMNYAMFHDYFIDKSSTSYKAPINQLYNTANVYTPKHTTI